MAVGAASRTTESLRSADGSVLGYRQLGSGPGLILLHGGMMAAQNFMRLAELLSDSFTVYVPDRRGRGTSGAYGARYGIARDCEDVQTLVEKTGSERIFGLSSGAIIALEAALVVPRLSQVAAYEPPYSIAGRDNAFWLERFDAEVAAGELGAALATLLFGTGDPPFLRFVPRALLAKLFGLAISDDAKKTKPGDVSMRELIPTMHYDALLVRETSPEVERLRHLQARVLLLGGSKSAAFLRRGLDALEALLPKATRVTLRGMGHIAADNESKPALVAEALRAFF